ILLNGFLEFFFSAFILIEVAMYLGRAYLKNHLFLILFVGITLLMTACAGEDNNTNSDAADNNEASAENGNLTVDLASAPVSLDPHAANDGNSLYVMNAMYDTLVQMNKIERATCR